MFICRGCQDKFQELKEEKDLQGNNNFIAQTSSSSSSSFFIFIGSNNNKKDITTACMHANLGLEI